MLVNRKPLYVFKKKHTHTTCTTKNPLSIISPTAGRRNVHGPGLERYRIKDFKSHQNLYKEMTQTLWENIIVVVLEKVRVWWLTPFILSTEEAEAG